MVWGDAELEECPCMWYDGPFTLSMNDVDRIKEVEEMVKRYVDPVAKPEQFRRDVEHFVIRASGPEWWKGL